MENNEARTPVNGTTQCLLSTCGKDFYPLKSNQRFCCSTHKADYYKLAYEKGVKAMESKGIHAAKMENSPRLRNIYTLLSDGEWHTGMDIMIIGPTTAPGSAIQELKHPINGYIIESRCEKRTANNRPLWEYRLIKENPNV